MNAMAILEQLSSDGAQKRFAHNPPTAFVAV
jgi:hypothetical protein